MSSVIHYKLKASKTFDTLAFEGSSLTLANFKERVMRDKKFRTVDLAVLDQTEKEITDPDFLIPKNSTLFIRRVPVNVKKDPVAVVASALNEPEAPPKSVVTSSSSVPISQTFSAEVAVDEQARLNDLMMESGRAHKPTKVKSTSNPPPPGYKCYICSIPGHWIDNCPSKKDPDATAKIQPKAPTGIPRNLLRPGSDDSGYVLPSGGMAALVQNESQFHRTLGMRTTPTVVPIVTSKPVNESTDVSGEIPADLMCLICSRLMVDPSLVQCCGQSFCKACILTAAKEDPHHRCPVCRNSIKNETMILPNRVLASTIERERTRLQQLHPGMVSHVAHVPPLVLQQAPSVVVQHAPPPAPLPDVIVVPPLSFESEVAYVQMIVETMIAKQLVTLPEQNDVNLDVLIRLFLSDCIRAARVSLVQNDFTLQDPGRPILLQDLPNFEHLITLVKHLYAPPPVPPAPRSPSPQRAPGASYEPPLQREVERPPVVPVEHTPVDDLQVGVKRRQYQDEEQLPPPKLSRVESPSRRSYHEHEREREPERRYREPEPYTPSWKSNPRYNKFIRVMRRNSPPRDYDRPAPYGRDSRDGYRSQDRDYNRGYDDRDRFARRDSRDFPRRDYRF
ncbi:hypothetical protein RCL1_001764 [Eukaryota sp. TZLM3-RCL]